MLCRVHPFHVGLAQTIVRFAHFRALEDHFLKSLDRAVRIARLQLHHSELVGEVEMALHFCECLIQRGKRLLVFPQLSVDLAQKEVRVPIGRVISNEGF